MLKWKANMLPFSVKSIIWTQYTQCEQYEHEGLDTIIPMIKSWTLLHKSDCKEIHFCLFCFSAKLTLEFCYHVVTFQTYSPNKQIVIGLYSESLLKASKTNSLSMNAMFSSLRTVKRMCRNFWNEKNKES